MSSQAPVKFGILSAASIAREFLNGLEPVPNAVCEVVASRDIEKARRFAKARNIPRTCTYEQILEEPIDAVYIPLPTALTTDWAIRCAKAGKHIIVDKPLNGAKDVQSIIDACRDSGVVFLDGTHFVHSSRAKIIRDVIKSHELGDVLQLNTTFSFPIPDFKNDIRSNPQLEPQGSLGDLGWYTSRAAVTYLGVDVASKILSVTCKGTMHPELAGVLNAAHGIVEFGDSEENKIMMSFDVDFRGPLRQYTEIVSQKGCIYIPEFILPSDQTFVFAGLRSTETRSTDTEYVIEKSAGIDANGGPTIVYPQKEVVVVKEPNGSTQHSNMVSEMCRMILEKDMESARKWANETLVTQKLVDVLYEAATQ